MSIIKAPSSSSSSYIDIYCRQLAKKLFRMGLRESDWSKIIEEVSTNLEDRYYEEPPSSLAQIEKEYGLIDEVIKAYDFSNSNKIRYLGAWGVIWIIISSPILFYLMIYNLKFNIAYEEEVISPSLALIFLLTNLLPIFVFVSSYVYYVLLDNIFTKLHVYDPRFWFVSKIRKFLLFLPLLGYITLVNFTLRNSNSGLNQISDNSDIVRVLNTAYFSIFAILILLIVQIVFHLWLHDEHEKKYYQQRYSIAFAAMLLPAMSVNNSISRIHYGSLDGPVIIASPIIVWLYMFNKAKIERDSKMFIRLWIYSSLFLGILFIYNITGAGWSFFPEFYALDSDHDKSHIANTFFYLFMWLVISIIIMKSCGLTKFRLQLGFVGLVKYKFSKTRVLSVVLILLMTLVAIQPTTDYSTQYTLGAGSGGGSSTSTNSNLPLPIGGIIIPHRGDLTLVIIVPKKSYIVYTFVIQNNGESYLDVISDPSKSSQIIIGDIPTDNVTTNPTTSKILLFSFDDKARLFYDFNSTIWSSEPYRFEFYIYFKSRLPIFSGWAQLLSFVLIITSFVVDYKPEDGI